MKLAKNWGLLYSTLGGADEVLHTLLGRPTTHLHARRLHCACTLPLPPPLSSFSPAHPPGAASPPRPPPTATSAGPPSPPAFT
jgi:hypothetical protein